jgi:hypothetical protein
MDVPVRHARAGRAFVLNLDADVELAAGANYAPAARTIDAVRANVPALARHLLNAEDLLVDEDASPDSARGREGHAFCPTPRALATLRRAGAEPAPHPTFEVLRRVNSRAFSASLGETLESAAFATDLASASSIIARSPPFGRGWRVKRAFGMAGRGQRLIAPGVLDGAELAFVNAGLAREGGVQIEPDVEILCELSLHAMLERGGGSGTGVKSGRLTTGALVRQRCDARGAWLSTEPLASDAPERAHEDALRAELARVASALESAGYFGPFGIDAFTYRGARGDVMLQPRSEINARYSMGWPIGMRAKSRATVSS